MNKAFEEILEELEKYKCSHLIERTSEQLIHCTETEDGECFGVECTMCVFNKAIKIVQEVAEEFGTDTNVGTNGWIPCSERLPETYDNLLICQSDGYVNVGYYSLGEFKDMDSILYKDVIAWQPLPEPYTK